MKTYYTGEHAKSYNQTWKVFSKRTLAATCSAIDFRHLQKVSEEREQRLRILDVGCGTGLLLQMLAERLPDAELYGVDESQDMLIQARLLLKNHPHVHFAQCSILRRIEEKEKTRCHTPIPTDANNSTRTMPNMSSAFAPGAGNGAGLPYEPATFDLITCTNTFHYLNNPVSVLEGLAQLLIPQGQLVIEDYARRGFPFPWKLFEWFIRRIDPQHIRAFTLAEARNLCQLADLQVVTAREFPIDLLWQGWVMATTIPHTFSSQNSSGAK